MKRVLVINPFGIGDAIFSMTVVRALRRARPDIFIGFLCNERTEDLVRTNTDINQTFVFNRDFYRALRKKSFILFWKNLRGLLHLIRETHFDTVLDFSLGREYGFFSKVVGIPVRAGLDYKNRGLFLNKKIKIKGYEGQSVVDIQLGLLDKLGVSYEKNNSRLPFFIGESLKKETAGALEKSFGKGTRLIGLAPGGGKSWGRNASYKQWNPQRFAEAVNRWNKESAYKTLLFGSPDEKSLLEETAALITGGKEIICQDSLSKTAAFLTHCDLLLCNDGGLLHLANSLGVKTVSIFGPVDEKVYGPYGQETAHAVLAESVSCRPCYKNFYFPPCPNGRICLEQISADKVLEAIKNSA